MLLFIYKYKDDVDKLDIRVIANRNHDGILFKTMQIEYYRMKQDPYCKTVDAWNDLPPNIRNYYTIPVSVIL